MEEQFLSQLSQTPQDDETRQVYADWLSEAGHNLKAEFLNLELGFNAAENLQQRNGLRAELAQLIQQLPFEWLIRVQRVPVEVCGKKRRWGIGRAKKDGDEIEFHFECTRKWVELEETSHKRVRYCDGCKKNVYFALSKNEARALARMNRCVAICPSVDRKQKDLMPRRGPNSTNPGARMGRIMSPRLPEFAQDFEDKN